MRGPRICHDGPPTGVGRYWLGRAWMAITGWDVAGEPPQGIRSAVLIAAPHTSNWDLVHMLAASFVFRIRLSWMGKDALFRPPLGWLLRALGGVPVDRSAPHGMVGQMAERLTSGEPLVLAIPPSGTRKKKPNWKSGFYWIAVTAKVPIVCGTVDYGKRQARLSEAMVPTGDVRADMDRIRAFYADARGKFPQNETRMVLKEEAGGEAAPS